MQMCVTALLYYYERISVTDKNIKTESLS